jgi:hypothetical protein
MMAGEPPVVPVIIAVFDFVLDRLFEEWSLLEQWGGSL